MEQNKMFYIKKRERRYPWSMPNSHYHSYYEIYFLVSGTRRFLIRDRVYDMRAGDVIMLAPNVYHRSIGSGTHIRVNIEFTREFIRKFFTSNSFAPLLNCFESGFISLTENESVEFSAITERLSEEYKNTDNLYFITFAEAMRLLCRAAKRQNDALPSNQAFFTASDTLRPIVEYINTHYSDISSLDDITKSCCINKSYMCRLFKKEMNITVGDYVSNVRVQESCELLASTDFSLTQISHQCGFSTPSSFSLQFKKMMGCTPSEFRKQTKTTEL
jgi:AraC-like DNA-binding protein